MRYAVIDASGLIVNVVMMAKDANWSPPEGCTCVPCPAHVGIGWKRSGKTKWTAPVPPEVGFDRAFVEGE